MERYTFDEIKNFQLGDIFWARNAQYEVSCQPTYISESNFYGDYSEKIEWTAIDIESKRESIFQVTNVRDHENASNPIIFKTPTSEPKCI